MQPVRESTGAAPRFAGLVLAVVLTACGGAAAGTPPTTPTEAPAPDAGPSTTRTAGATTTTQVGEPIDIGTVTIDDSACALDLVEGYAGGTVDAGRLAVTVINESSVRAGTDAFWVTDDHTFEDFIEHIETEMELAEAGEPFLGPPEWARSASGGSGLLETGVSDVMQISARLPGIYVIVCLIHAETEDFVLPFQLVGPLRVEG